MCLMKSVSAAGVANRLIAGSLIVAVLALGLKPRDTVVMDHSPSHKIAGVREAIKGAGERSLFLPGTRSCPP